MEDIVTQPTPSELIAACEANYRAYFEGFANLPQCEFHRTLELTWFLVDGPPGSAVLQTRLSAEQVDARIAETLRMFKTRARDGWWQVLPSCQPTNLAARLQAHGLAKTESRPVMTAQLSDLEEVETIPNIVQIERVRDSAMLEEWLAASAAGFGMDMERAQVYFDAYEAQGFALEGQWRHSTGYMKGKAVTSSTLLLAAGVAGLYDISTVPAARRQGFGRAITLHAMLEAKQRGYAYAVLQSSHEGYELYRRLGFTELYHEENYMWRRDA